MKRSAFGTIQKICTLAGCKVAVCQVTKANSRKWTWVGQDLRKIGGMANGNAIACHGIGWVDHTGNFLGDRKDDVNMPYGKAMKIFWFESQNWPILTEDERKKNFFTTQVWQQKPFWQQPLRLHYFYHQSSYRYHHQSFCHNSIYNTNTKKSNKHIK